MESTSVAETHSPEFIETSQPFVGEWNTLISTTNWEKGEIICKWREALRNEGQPSSDWSDEKWSSLVGGVTSQHVGRLRRTSERFGVTFRDYEGLFWSHFYAALDWDDAEMWLEGSVQNGWSISQMRKQRWETLGKIPEDEPKDGDIVVVESDEETQSLALSDKVRDNEREFVEGPRYDGPDFGDEDEPSSSKKGGDSKDASLPEDVEKPKPTSDGTRPFESFTDLPDDVSAAADAFKICIISHRADDWESISRVDMLGLLDALKQLVGTEVATKVSSETDDEAEPEAAVASESGEE